MERFDVSLRTAYAQARELALAQRSVPLVTPGTIGVEPRGQKRFVYRYRYAAGERVAEYLGPEGDDETRRKLADAQAEIAESALLSGYSRDLRRLGFYSVDNSTATTVAVLFNAGIFGGGGVLVGTHAFGVLLNDLGVRATPLARTEDVDLARPHRIELAGRGKVDLLALLASTGLRFTEVPQLKRKAPPTSYRARGKALTVDLLVPQKGEPYAPVPVPELGAHATGLPHFRYLLEGPDTSMVLARDRIIPVAVPHPGRFCIHKLAVYSLRGGANPKREKDVRQAALMAEALAEEQDFVLEEAMEQLDAGLRKKVKPGARRAVEILGDSRAADLLRPLVE